ncbi:MAG: CopG family transcriptional regulator [Desulfurococcales archaeon]|nr:CopG family transcriptional regulator [Desulfurococcales archaeon]
MSGETVEVKIKKELYDKAVKFIEEQGGFDSVEELIEFLLSEVLEEGSEEQALSPEEEEKVKERLRKLGYM